MDGFLRVGFVESKFLCPPKILKTPPLNHTQDGVKMGAHVRVNGQMLGTASDQFLRLVDFYY